MIIGDGFLSEFLLERTVYISGRLGAGKSLLAAELAETLLRKGYRLYTNVRCVWAEDDMVPGTQIVYWVDEGGMYLRRQADVLALAGFLRKLDSYLIISGKKPPHLDLCTLWVSPRFDFWVNFFIPAKVWRYDVFQSEFRSYHGYFIQVWPQRYWGVYSTLDPGDHPQDVIAVAVASARQLYAQYGRRYAVGAGYQVSAVAGGDDAAEEIARVAARVSRAAEALAGGSRPKTRVK